MNSYIRNPDPKRLTAPDQTSEKSVFRILIPRLSNYLFSFQNPESRSRIVELIQIITPKYRVLVVNDQCIAISYDKLLFKIIKY
jgi:hypothetical protein